MGFVNIGPKAQYAQDNCRKNVCVDGRYVTVIRHNNKLYCMDTTCYHMGGPLAAGDIEDIGGKPCIVCPWHKYKVDLETGCGMYMNLERKMQSSGKKQRCHKVEERGDDVYVELDTESGKLASDGYAFVELQKDNPAKEFKSAT